ncbi:MAG: hypothetical protein ACYCYO_20730 [Bacilli bacterium]
MRTYQVVNVTGFYNQNASDVILLPSVFFGVLALDRLWFTYRIDPSTDGGFDVSIRIMDYGASANAFGVADGEMGCRLRGESFWLVHTNTVEDAMVFITLDGLLPLVAWDHSGSAGH